MVPQPLILGQVPGDAAFGQDGGLVGVHRLRRDRQPVGDFRGDRPSAKARRALPLRPPARIKQPLPARMRRQRCDAATPVVVGLDIRGEGIVVPPAMSEN